ncbi:hypothetical protein BPT24_279 [Tenacibaculum phage pT24]|uniref:Uncharacterized protein n=1 Tax=Tenacibaculum phage pT24 TaxID=1880590 RepID=A0A1B4XX65_9CAUD|nr:hypothetical protein HYP10_gp249 [Tenacibaculum phage pT24]BAV39396.1 hypothetical protein BPT24_279 [Tenacibaculum phage pT24]
MQNLVGQTIVANVTSSSSFYKKVEGVVIEDKGDRLEIQATRVISNWSSEWKNHPTSCAMSVLRTNLIK